MSKRFGHLVYVGRASQFDDEMALKTKNHLNIGGFSFLIFGDMNAAEDDEYVGSVRQGIRMFNIQPGQVGLCYRASNL